MDDLRSLVSKKYKDLDEGGFQRTPLRDVEGVLDGFDVRPFQSFGKDKLAVQFNLKDIKVLESSVPWNFPIAQIEVVHGNKNTAWGTLSKSAAGLYGEECDFPKDLVGKRVRFKLMPHLVYKSKEEPSVPGEQWEVVEPSGGVGAGVGVSQPSMGDFITTVLTLLAGKTQQEFNPEALRNPVVKASGQMNSILNGDLIASLVEQKLVHKDADNRYQLGAE